MSNLTKDDQLLSFIEKKKQSNSKLDIKRVYFIFTKAIRGSLVKTYSKLDNLQYSIDCTEMIFPIFWIILLYTNNLKLTMFLSERAVILFTEYISLSQSMSGDDNINMIDVKSFIYKKTLGPLKLTKSYQTSLSQDIDSLKTISANIKNILYKVFRNILSDNITISQIDDILENVCCLISNVSFKVNSILGNNILDKLLYIPDETSNDDIFININLIKYRLEIYHYLIVNIKDKYQIENIFSRLDEFLQVNHNRDNTLLSTDIKIQSTDLFKSIISHHKNTLNN